MGLLDKLWDDTLAGPPPDDGLGRLRKYQSFPPTNTPAGRGDEVGMGETKGNGKGIDVEPKVTRKIMIKVPPGWASPVSGTPPSSPAGSTTPVSPFSSGREWRNMSRRKLSTPSSESYRSKEDDMAIAVDDWTSSYPPFQP